jgi:putative oxidoreductase
MHALGLLVLRIGLGVVFVAHGLDKLGDLDGTAQGFDGMGIPLPDVMAPFVAIVEVGGGALLVLGLLTPLAGIMLAGDMLVAGITAHPDAFFAQDGGFEFVMVLGLASLALALTGPGAASLDARIGLTPKQLRQRRRGAVTA